MKEPVTIYVALGGVLSTGVSLVAVFYPGLTQEMQIAIIAFGNAVILTASVVLARRESTPLADPKLVIGTSYTATDTKGEAVTVNRVTV